MLVFLTYMGVVFTCMNFVFGFLELTLANDPRNLILRGRKILEIKIGGETTTACISFKLLNL